MEIFINFREIHFMKVSIITPSFNQGKFLKKCLASVRQQKGDFTVEHIILDNCSTDTTGKHLADYQYDPGTVDVKVIVEPDEGQTSAINKGFSLATGDIVCWLNTDEWYGENTVMKVVNYFLSHPEVDIVFGDCDFVDTSGKLLKRKHEFFYSKSMLIFYGCYIPSCATFLRRKVIDDSVLLNNEFKVTMDFDWYVRLAKAGCQFVHLPSLLASFTWHDSNISSNFVERRLEERRLVQDRHSGVGGPAWFRTWVYFMMRYFWVTVRVFLRFIKTISRKYSAVFG